MFAETGEKNMVLTIINHRHMKTKAVLRSIMSKNGTRKYNLKQNKKNR